jgi:hypothetical protein
MGLAEMLLTVVRIVNITAKEYLIVFFDKKNRMNMCKRNSLLSLVCKNEKSGEWIAEYPTPV